MSGPTTLADGTHRGLRWWAMRYPDAPHPVISVGGWVGRHLVQDGCDMPGASKAAVERWIDDLVAAAEIKAAKAEAKAARKAGAGD